MRSSFRSFRFEFSQHSSTTRPSVEGTDNFAGPFFYFTSFRSFRFFELPTHADTGTGSEKPIIYLYPPKRIAIFSLRWLKWGRHLTTSSYERSLRVTTRGRRVAVSLPCKCLGEGRQNSESAHLLTLIDFIRKRNARCKN